MKRRRRRKIRVVRVTIFVVAILIVIFVGSKGAGFLINLKQTDTEEVTAKYKAETPVKRDYNEAEKKLAGYLKNIRNLSQYIITEMSIRRK